MAIESFGHGALPFLRLLLALEKEGLHHDWWTRKAVWEDEDGIVENWRAVRSRTLTVKIFVTLRVGD
jgi:hypothetical protein